MSMISMSMDDHVSESVDGQEAKDKVTPVQETSHTRPAGQQRTMTAGDSPTIEFQNGEETSLIENKETCKKRNACKKRNLRKRKPNTQKGKCKNEKQIKNTRKPKVPVIVKVIKWRNGKESVFIENTNECKKSIANDEIFLSPNDDERQHRECDIKLSKEDEKSDDTRKMEVFKREPSHKSIEIGVSIRSVYLNKKPRKSKSNNKEDKPKTHSKYELDDIFIEKVFKGPFDQTLYVFGSLRKLELNAYKTYSTIISFFDSKDTGYCAIKYLGPSEFWETENVVVSGIQIIFEEFKLYCQDNKPKIENFYESLKKKGYGGTLEIFEWECFLLDRHPDIEREDLVAIRHLILIMRKNTTTPRTVFDMLYFLTCDVRIFECIFSVPNFNMAMELSIKAPDNPDRILNGDQFQGKLITEIYKFIDQCIEILKRLIEAKNLKSKVKYDYIWEEKYKNEKWLMQIIQKILNYSPGDKGKKNCVKGFLKKLLKLFSEDQNPKKISESFQDQLKNLLKGTHLKSKSISIKDLFYRINLLEDLTEYFKRLFELLHPIAPKVRLFITSARTPSQAAGYDEREYR